MTYLRCDTKSALAFGGGQAALPLVERLTVHDTHWLTPEIFATGVGLSYVTPGPVVILATYVGERVAGVPGAVAATIAVFTVPVALAGAAARAALHLQRHRWFRSFGSYAAAAAIGLLGVTLFDLARPLGELTPSFCSERCW